MNALTRLILLSFSILLSACATTQIEESWRLPGYQPPADAKILVVALTPRETVRKAFEGSFVQALEDKGYTAVASNQWISDANQVTKDKLRPLLKQNNITTLMISSIKAIEESQTYQPSQAVGPQDNLYRNFDTYQVFSSSGQHETGTYNERTEYVLETNLFDARTEKLSWSVTTRSNEPRTLQKSISKVVKKVLAEAEKDKIL